MDDEGKDQNGSNFTLIFHVRLVEVPVREAIRTASSEVPDPASIYMCDPVFVPQICGVLLLLAMFVPVFAFVPWHEKLKFTFQIVHYGGGLPESSLLCTDPRFLMPCLVKRWRTHQNLTCTVT